MMQIFLDNIVFSIQKAGGVSVYWYELLRGLCKTGLPVNFLNTGLNPGNIFERRINYQSYNCIRESWIPPRYLRYLPLRYTLPEQSVFHGGYLRVTPQKNVLNMLTVHDFAHERKLATGFPRGLANIKQKAYGIKRADGIICISDSTRQELLHFYPHTDPERVRVIHHGIGDDFYPLEKTSERTCSVLYVGARAHYKNFNIALATMQALPDKYTLVVAGGGTWSKQEMQEIEAAIPGRYTILETVDVAQLNRLYNDACCLLYPSSYEGFGFPPGEAMKAGCPVVSTTSTSIPEVTGRAGLLTKDITAAAFAEKICTLENDIFRQRIIQDGLQQAALFTWDKTVNETIQFYKDCWNNKF